MISELIHDLDDPRLAVYRSLKATNATRDLDCFVVEGEKLVERLIASRFPVASVLVTDRHLDRLAATIPDGVPVYVVPFEKVHDLVGFPFHRGALACGRRLPRPDWRALWGTSKGPLTFAICPQISNPENVGSIARLCDAFGVDGIFAGSSCPDPLSRRVLRVSMGSTLRVPIVVADDLLGLASELESALGVGFLAAVADDHATPFGRVEIPSRVGLVLGDEDRGVDPDWLARCRHAVTIPMNGRASSLNVSTAAAILLYHFSRRDGD
ncbi:TrmH family RNA methyltransferase [Planctomyces sp. SH-PL62]|uniref:TrmH family RNA methyltransferase n=1 Tax=Planctomyces sp. SH-PL62 TaxID=1636152 RepID=UPI00078C3604|nr:RNA methyltransferase [Planctomyces sp. SH-PL62]AMV36821.1 Putative TrmH family tRNA/rRNA methyltransferase [Planctomyces sp. SH-PL62]